MKMITGLKTLELKKRQMSDRQLCRVLKSLSPRIQGIKTKENTTHKHRQVYVHLHAHP